MIRTLGAAAAFLVAFSGAAFAQEAASIIHAGRLLADPATGQVLTQQSVLIGEDGNVLEIEPGYITRDGAAIIDLSNAFVLPGLIDSHVHLTGELGPNQLLEEVQLTASDAALRGAENARKTLLAGFTTVADLGAMNDSIFALRRAIAENRVPGPRIIAAGSAVTPDGGHADANGFAPDIIDALRNPNACSGADACRRAVRRQVQAGADVIKITATGGVLSNTAASNSAMKKSPPSSTPPTPWAAASPRTPTAATVRAPPCAPASIPSNTAPISTTPPCD